MDWLDRVVVSLIRDAGKVFTPTFGLSPYYPRVTGGFFGVGGGISGELLSQRQFSKES